MPSLGGYEREFQYNRWKNGLDKTISSRINLLIAPLSDIPMSCNAQSAHACRCNKAVIVLLCVCTGDNPLAKARGLSSRAQ